MIKSENLFQELFENSGAIVLITDEKYTIRYSSSGVESILGLKPITLAGKNAFDFAPSGKRDVWAECLRLAGNSKRAEILLKSQAGDDLYFDVSVSNQIAHHEIHGMVIILHDITAQKRQHLQLEKKNEHLDQFIYKTTHDLRSPIQSVMGLLTLMEEADEKERGRYLEMARNSLVKLEALIDEVNNLYRVDKMAIAHEEINIQILLEEEISTLKNHPRAQNLEFILNSRVEADLFSDSLRLKTIFGNILSNAVKYSDTKKKKSFIEIETTVNSKGLLAIISDNGIGIAKENLDHIFDIFFRATTQASGTGLGLHIVKDTLERLNGKIDVHSQLGIGTQFKIFLPARFVSTPEAVLSVDEKEILS